MCTYGGPLEKFDPPPRDYLLVIHNNYGPTPYRFRDKWQFRWKFENFSHPMHLMPILRRFPLEFCNGAAVQKK